MPENVPAFANWKESARNALKPLSTVKELAAALISKRQELIDNSKGLSGRARMALLSDLIDVVVQRMLEVACEQVTKPSESSGQGLSPLAVAQRSLAIVATGGYGRRELAPFSDIDISFISASDDDPLLDEITREMFRLIMDVFLAEANLKVGYAYRLLEEAAGLHHQNQTALLDARFVSGSRELAQSFQDELRRSIHPVAFMHDKLKEREASISRHGRGVYRVEPDIKEGEGSLRDLHLTSWLAQVAYGFDRETVWEDIRQHGLLTSAEVDRVYDVMEMFSRIRWKMHLESGRQADTLTSQKQSAIAPKLGYEDSQEEPAVVTLMRDYYRHAEGARRTAEKMLRRVRSKRMELEPGLCAEDGQVVLDNPEAFLNDPVACLRAFAYCQRYGLTLSQMVTDAIRLAVASAAPPVGDAPDAEDAARLFLMILRSDDVGDAIIEMSHCGVLGWYIPEFGRVMGQIPFDAAHEYTVGWHSLQVVRHCERLTRSSDEDARRIYANIRRPEILYLAALLHDIAKGGAGGKHAERGAIMVREIGQRLRLDDQSIVHLEFLVRHHQLMSDTARLRDLNLRRTVDDFVAVVNDVELLSMLYMLTNADILGVGASGWSEIQGRFLRELYFRAERAIVTKAPLIDSEEDLAQYRSRVRRELSLTALPPEAVEEHIVRMPPMYLLNTRLEEMAEHVEFIQKALQGEPSVSFKADAGSDYTELTLCVEDDPHPGLLSKIAGVLWALDVDVHAAQVFTRGNGGQVALDMLYVAFEDKQLPEFKKQQLQKEMVRVLKGELDLKKLLEQHQKKLSPDYQSRTLEVSDHLSEEHTVVDVRTKDQPGLLYRFTRAFAELGWHIHSARVSTWGQDVRDSFYVTREGKKIGPEAAGELERTLQALGGGGDFSG